MGTASKPTLSTTPHEQGPDATPSRRRGRPRTLSVDDVVDAAGRVLDRGGPDAVAIRSVAAELGVHPTSLYVYVESREHLLRVLAERLVADFREAAGTPEPTRDSVIRTFTAFRAMLTRHPRLLRISQSISVDELPDSMLHHTDAVVRYLQSRGLSDSEAVRGFWTLRRFTIGSAWLGHNASQSESTQASAEVTRLLDAPHLKELRGARLVYRSSTSGELDFESDLVHLLDLLAP